ncbi:MAG: HAD family hydrolase [Thermoplasmatota archaeon]
MNIERIIKGSPLAVFDFDGTLFNVNIDWQEVYERLSWISREYGHVGMFRSLSEAFEWSGRVYRSKERLVDAQTDLEQVGIETVTEIPKGVKAAKWRLDRGLKCSVLSLNTTYTLDSVLGSWGFFPIMSIENVERPKPDPEGLLVILKAHKKGPDEAVFIGNSDIDRMCAGAAEVPFVHIDDIKEEWFE